MKDIVNELRAWEKSGADNVMGRAADEIERLCAELDRIGLWMRITNAEIKRLHAERDEARREVCYLRTFHGQSRDYALQRGWDCFDKEIL